MTQPGPGTYRGSTKLNVTGKEQMDPVMADAIRQIERWGNGLLPPNPTANQVLMATGAKVPQGLKWGSAGGTSTDRLNMDVNFSIPNGGVLTTVDWTSATVNDSSGSSLTVSGTDIDVNDTGVYAVTATVNWGPRTINRAELLIENTGSPWAGNIQPDVTGGGSPGTGARPNFWQTVTAVYFTESATAFRLAAAQDFTGAFSPNFIMTIQRIS